MKQQVAKAQETWPFLDLDTARRLFGAYGTRLERVLGSAQSWSDLGTRFGADLTEAEVRYLMQHEWAESADDILCRRTKLGLQFSDSEKEALSAFMTGPGQPAASRVNSLQS